ncbi:cell growth-regulating nucleolar protein [Garra rufa]|uniref:cell growth-regulating nucleolar protein n=1 Tax=Garra rufa TaxID=137080 RepID=UPI003CCEB9A0
MVVFTCGSCGESVKKAQVEQHVIRCRSCRVLSCIDCGKDFRDDEYRNHNKCISEDQKYGGKGFQPKVNKGEVKQEEWLQRIQQAMGRPDIEPNVWSVLQMVSTHSNVPRKKNKFENWMKNCMRNIYTPALLEKVWEICSSTADSNSSQTNHQKSEPKPNQTDLNNGTETKKNKREERKNKKDKKKQKISDENSEEQNGENTDEKQKRKKRKRDENGQNEDGKSSKKQKKRKQEELDESVNSEGEEPENQEPESNPKGKFNWKGTIKAVLRDAPEDGLSVKKLRKKVLAAYYSFTGDSNFRSEEEVLSVFNRKLNKNPKFRILKDKVRLVK